MIKIFYHKEFYNSWCSEIAILYSDLIKQFEINDSRFEKLKNEYFIFVNNIENCDYVVLPYKWRGFDKVTNVIIEDCKLNNKKLLVFYNDDNSKPINLGPEAIIFRTSIFKYNKFNNEYSLPPFFDDEFTGDFINTKNIDLNIGFCGFDHYERKEALSRLKDNSLIKTDFIVRKSFWAREIDEKQAIAEFNNNIKNNLFNFCSRGSGNFSYRFYQVLSMGRIPLLLNTDCALPFENLIDYSKHCLIVDISDINIIGDKLVNFYMSKSKNDLYKMQEDNRKLYEEFLSPSGFLKAINFTLSNNEL